MSRGVAQKEDSEKVILLKLGLEENEYHFHKQWRGISLLK